MPIDILFQNKDHIDLIRERARRRTAPKCIYLEIISDDEEVVLEQPRDTVGIPLIDRFTGTFQTDGKANRKPKKEKQQLESSNTQVKQL